jgi:protease-4
VDALIQAGVSQTYARFLVLVSQARHLPLLRVDAIGQGRVWDGGRARALGLVDRFGGLPDAIAEAARRAHLDPAKVHPVYVERPSSLRLRLLKRLTSGDDATNATASRDAFARLHAGPEAAVAGVLGEVRRIVAGPAIQARCLVCAAAQPPAPSDSAAARRLLAAGGL